MNERLFDIKPLTISKNEWCNEDRPKYKIMTKGCSALTDTEVLSIILGEKDSLELSRTIMNGCGNNLRNMGKLSVHDLMKFGLTENKALLLTACCEFGRRRQKAELPDKVQIKCSGDVADLLRPILSDLDHEQFWVLFLNRTNVVIAHECMSKGGMSGTVTDVRIILKRAIELKAQAIIIAHNHPSGNLHPSESDTKITQKIKEGGNILDVSLLDHVIIADREYYSFADNGLV